MHVAITATSIDKMPQARRLAKKLNLTYIEQVDPPSTYDYLILVTDTHISLKNLKATRSKPFYIDFNANKMLYRLQHATRRKELIARAIGIKPDLQPRIIDATAGIGRDGMILATLGYHLTLLERSPVLHLLLDDALQRAKELPLLAPIIKRICLIHTDARCWLKQLASSERPDIIYLDPMFPERQKSALVKKEMVLLQNLLGKDSDAQDLFSIALSCALKRVVVKRPKLAANIGDLAPNFSITGKKNRFDVYLT